MTRQEHDRYALIVEDSEGTYRVAVWASNPDDANKTAGKLLGETDTVLIAEVKSALSVETKGVS